MSKRTRRKAAQTILAVGALAVTAGASASNNDGDEKVAKVVYHINDTARQATAGLRNIRNHLSVAPKTRIIVVTHATGIDFLLEDAKDPKNSDIDYPSLVSALTAQGVRFEVCEIAMRGRGLDKDDFIMDANFTPSGVVRVTQLQNDEQFAYLKP